MATARRKSKKQAGGSPGTVRRGPGDRRGLRRLPKDLEDLASGRRRRLRPPRGPGDRIVDPRVGGLIAGVANRDARAVYEARTAWLRNALERGEADDALGRALREAQQLALWRGGNVTGFAVWVQEVLRMPLERARALAAGDVDGATSPVDRLPDRLVALWVRGEAALRRTCPDARLHVTGRGEQATLHLALPAGQLADALNALQELGQTAAGLRRVLEEKPR